MIPLLLNITALVLGAVGAWLNITRIVGLGVVALALVGLFPYLD